MFCLLKGELKILLFFLSNLPVSLDKKTLQIKEYVWVRSSDWGVVEHLCLSVLRVHYLKIWKSNDTFRHYGKTLKILSVGSALFTS